MPSIRISNENSLMELMNDEETKRNVTDLEISRISYFNGSLLLCDFVNLKKLEISGDFKGTLSVEISGILLIIMNYWIDLPNLTIIKMGNNTFKQAASLTLSSIF